MIKKLLFSLIILAFISCKKNTPIHPDQNEINPVGTWYLKSTNDGATTYDSSGFPCLSDNKLILNSDGTYHTHYAGTDSCYLIHTSTVKVNIGIPGQPDISGTFTQNKNTLFFKNQYGSFSNTISNSNGLIQMTERDTIVNNISTSVFIKL